MDKTDLWQLTIEAQTGESEFLYNGTFIMFPEPVDESLAQAYADHQWSRNQDLESWEAVIETPSVKPIYNYSKEITKFIKSHFYIEYPNNIILTKLQKESEVQDA